METAAKNMKVQQQKVQVQQPFPACKDDFFLPDPNARNPDKLDLNFASGGQSVKADLMSELWEIYRQNQNDTYSDTNADTSEIVRQSIASQAF